MPMPESKPTETSDWRTEVPFTVSLAVKLVSFRALWLAVSVMKPATSSAVAPALVAARLTMAAAGAKLSSQASRPCCPASR